MSSPTRPEAEPFNEPLSPLPARPQAENAAVPAKPKAVKPQAAQMEPERVLPPEDPPVAPTVSGLEPMASEVMESETELVVTESEGQKLPRWKFWKRPNKRDQQLETLREGAFEMVGLMRSIRDHLESERGDREGLRHSLSPLPVAVESLKTMSAHQADTGRVLGELRTTMEQRAEKDSLVLGSLNRIGNTMASVEETFGMMDRTLSGMDRSNVRTAASMEKLGERMAESDRFMNETFARLRDAEREFTDNMTRNSRRSGFAMAALCSILLLSVVAVGFMFKENRELLTAVQKSGALVVQVPVRTEPDKVVLFEELRQVDDGIGEPDREIVANPPESAPVAPATGTAPADDSPAERPALETEPEEGGLLSVNKLPRRE